MIFEVSSPNAAEKIAKSIRLPKNLRPVRTTFMSEMMQFFKFYMSEMMRFFKFYMSEMMHFFKFYMSEMMQ